MLGFSGSIQQVHPRADDCIVGPGSGGDSAESSASERPPSGINPRPQSRGLLRAQGRSSTTTNPQHFVPVRISNEHALDVWPEFITVGIFSFGLSELLRGVGRWCCGRQWLYRLAVEEVPVDDYTLPLSSAEVTC